jgi:hypothetical protein
MRVVSGEARRRCRERVGEPGSGEARRGDAAGTPARLSTSSSTRRLVNLDYSLFLLKYFEHQMVLRKKNERVGDAPGPRVEFYK